MLGEFHEDLSDQSWRDLREVTKDCKKRLKWGLDPKQEIYNRVWDSCLPSTVLVTVGLGCEFPHVSVGLPRILWGQLGTVAESTTDSLRPVPSIWRREFCWGK